MTAVSDDNRLHCPDCASPDNRVIDTRVNVQHTLRRRRYACSCGARFTTEERIVQARIGPARKRPAEAGRADDV